MVPFMARIGQAGVVQTCSHPRRARNLTELYLRAYWRHYLLAGAWVLLVTSIWPYR